VPFPALVGLGAPSTGGPQGYLIRYFGQQFAPWAPYLGMGGFAYGMPGPGFANPGFGFPGFASPGFPNPGFFGSGVPTPSYGYSASPTTGSSWNPFSGGYTPSGWFGY
jgi:hypothetical protein